MAKELVLLANVEGLGEPGTVVKVAEGYARNYLIPRKLGAPVTPAAMRRLDKMRRDREAREQTAMGKARELAQRLEQTSVSVAVKVGEGEKLFGSVTSADILDALKLQGIEIDKHAIDLAEPIRELGVFTITVKLHRQVEAPLKVWVVEE